MPFGWSRVGKSGGMFAVRSQARASLLAAALAAVIGGGACAKVSGGDPHEGSVPVGPPDAGGGSLPDVQLPVDHPVLCGPDAGGGCQTSRCGDGVVAVPKETCDDGNSLGGDGCSPDCKVETDWICTTPGQPCSSTVA